MTRKPLFMNMEWNEIALNTEGEFIWRIFMLANVQIDDHYCPDNADTAHKRVRKRHETGH